MGRVLTLALLLSIPASAQAAEGADAILRELGLASSAEIVSVEALRLANGSVMVTLVPDHATRLVGDPGISVLPVDAAGLPVAAPVILKDNTQEYFPLPPALTVDPGAATALRVEYAYCVVAKQCLFGDVTVPVPRQG